MVRRVGVLKEGIYGGFGKCPWQGPRKDWERFCGGLAKSPGDGSAESLAGSPRSEKPRSVGDS